MGKKIVVAAGLAAFLGLAGFAGAVLVTASSPAEASAAKKEGADESRKLPETAYVQLDPLAAPVIGGGKVRYNVMLTMSLEVGDQEQKASISRLMPRLRDAMLMELYARPVVRDDESGRIDLLNVKERMIGVAREVVGRGIVRDLLVVSAIRTS